METADVMFAEEVQEKSPYRAQFVRVQLLLSLHVLREN
jgi:hypothetical protein